jgi:hypothetical protein
MEESACKESADFARHPHVEKAKGGKPHIWCSFWDSRIFWTFEEHGGWGGITNIETHTEKNTLIEWARSGLVGGVYRWWIKWVQRFHPWACL